MEITHSTDQGTTIYRREDLGIVVASVQGNYRTKLYTGPDEFTYSEWGTREAAHNVARRHAASI